MNSLSAQQTWFTYIVQCGDGTLYTGVTTNIERRIDEHNSSNLGARYTRSRRPVQLAYTESCNDRSSACKREAQIKKLSRQAKQALIDANLV